MNGESKRWELLEEKYNGVVWCGGVGFFGSVGFFVCGRGFLLVNN